MMQAMTVYLRPDSSFRGSRPPRSDTLFGAICWGYQLIFDEARLITLLNAFQPESAPFLISSMFPYTEKDGQRSLSLPKPYTKPYQLPDKEQLDLDKLHALKQLKKQTVVSLKDFEAMIQGAKGEECFYQDALADVLEHKTQRYDLENACKPIKKSVTSFDVPHAAINRLTGAVEGSRFFYTEEYSPASEAQKQAGLFFFVKCREDLAADLQTVFRFLGDKGIGGGVSVGKGHFQIIEIADELPYREPPKADHVVTLSLTFPCAAIRSRLSESWYDIERRQGKIESMYAHVEHIWKDHLVMLKEGSTFPKNGQPFYGENPIVRKDDGKSGFDVRHYGYAFTVNTRHV